MKATRKCLKVTNINCGYASVNQFRINNLTTVCVMFIFVFLNCDNKNSLHVWHLYTYLHLKYGRTRDVGMYVKVNEMTDIEPPVHG